MRSCSDTYIDLVSSLEDSTTPYLEKNIKFNLELMMIIDQSGS